MGEGFNVFASCAQYSCGLSKCMKKWTDPLGCPKMIFSDSWLSLRASALTRTGTKAAASGVLDDPVAARRD